MRNQFESIAFVLIVSIILTISSVGAAGMLSTTIPIFFVQNDGQMDDQTLYFADAHGFGLYLVKDGEIFQPVDAPAVRITYLRANAAVSVEGEEELEGRANFLLGNNESQWITNVPTFSAVRYDDLYPGITLVYHAGTTVLKREFIVEPGVNPAAIKMQYSGQEGLSLTENGAILIRTSGGTLIETAPICYQVVDGQKVSVAGGYHLSSGNIVTFSLGKYEPCLPVIIDPVLDYSTYVGGTQDDRGAGIGLDDFGYIYIAGSTKSTNFPLSNSPPYQQKLNGSWDVFIFKIKPDGSLPVYSTYIGGFYEDQAHDLVVDNSTGIATITGYTYSPNYPITRGGPKFNESDVFVTQVNAAGSGLVWSTVLGGNWTEEGISIALRSDGDPVVVGFTGSSDFNVTTSDPWNGCTDAFVARFNGNNGARISNRYFGGSGNDYAYGVALNGTDRIFITGSTDSPNFTVAPGFRALNSGQTDAFITVMSPTLTILKDTYLGGIQNDIGTGIAVDQNSYPYITGYTNSPVSPYSLFPITPGAYQPNYAGGKNDAFITKMDPTLNVLNYSTYLGGNLEDRAYDIALDSGMRAYVTGWTTSDDFPTHNAIYPSRNGIRSDAFVTEMNTTGQDLVFSTYLGGSYVDEGRAIFVTPDGVNMTLTGYTESSEFPIARPYQGFLAGFPPIRYPDAFITKIVKLVPLVDFYGDPTIGCSPLTVNFTDASVGDPFPVTSWLWDFGDGTTSTEQNPVHTYYRNGTSAKRFNVTLTATNQDGSATLTRFFYIKVCPEMIPNFTSNKQIGCVGSNATIKFFNNTVGNPDMLYWDFGDGDVGTTGPGVTFINHKYTEPGLYTVTLIANNSCCNTSFIREEYIDIRDVPVANFTAEPRIGFVPLFVQFFNQSTGRPSSWEWDLGPVNSSEQNPNYTYTTTGNRTVKLTVCNFCGCNMSTQSKFIKVGDPLAASFVPNKTSGFAPLKVGFADTSTGIPTYWEWDFGDNTTPVNVTTNATQIHTFTDPGVYGVTLKVSNIFGEDLSPPQYITAGPRANVTWSPQTLIVPTNATTLVNLTLDQAPYGLAGYNITVYFDDVLGGNFTSIEFPPWAANLSHKGPLPAPVVALDAIDLDGIIDPGATNIPLAYFKVKGNTPMPTFLKVTINMMTDDIGGDVNPKTIPAKITVVRLLMFPGATKFPTDPHEDQKFYDVDGNKKITFNDVVIYYRNLQTGWTASNQYIPFFDYDNKNGVTFNDVIVLYNKAKQWQMP